MHQENFMPSFEIGYFNSKAAIIDKGIDIFDDVKTKGAKENSFFFGIDITKLSSYIQFRMRVRTRTETEDFFHLGDFKMCSLEDFTN